MEVYNLKWPWSILYRLFGRLNNREPKRKRSLVVIAKSPFPSKNKRENGEFIVKLDWTEIFAAFRFAAVIVGIVFVLSGALYHASERKR